MNKKILQIAAGITILISLTAEAQVNPAISSWIQNTTGITGRHYISGSSTPIVDATYPANCQAVAYNATDVYVSCSGIPAYVIGPYLDGNPSQGGNNNNKYKIPLNPIQNTGTPTATTGGTIGVFINGVSLFDYRDGVSYKSSTGADAGGPIPGGPGDGAWNRDAIPAEKSGFDCAKGHPAMTNYHHHQNPSAFNLDLNVISTVCNMYLADGLYVIDSTAHSPLIGYAYDGFPIYGAYGYKNVDGTGGIVRMKSSFSIRSITTRTIYYDGTTPTFPGPVVSASHPLGEYREDYQYTATSAATPDYLDIHNGRFCVTPEYPLGTYAYFCTVDANWNSYYPYVVGPTFYGTKVVTTVTTIPGGLTSYVSTTGVTDANNENLKVSIYPNPANDVLFIQSHLGGQTNRKVELLNALGQVVQTQTLFQGSTMCYFDLQTVYAGIYFVRVTDGDNIETSKVVVSK
jgi:hypothetical protein